CYRTGRAKRSAQIRPRQLRQNLLKCSEKEHPVFDDGSADCSPELIPPEILQRLPVRSIRRQPLRAEILEKASMHLIRSGFRNDVHYPSGRSSKFGVCAGGHDLKFLHRIQRDVDRRSLSAKLLSKKSVVVIATVQADVVEHSSLPVEVDFVPIRPLRDGH